MSACISRPISSTKHNDENSSPVILFLRCSTCIFPCRSANSIRDQLFSKLYSAVLSCLLSVISLGKEPSQVSEDMSEESFSMIPPKELLHKKNSPDLLSSIERLSLFSFICSVDRLFRLYTIVRYPFSLSKASASSPPPVNEQ